MNSKLKILGASIFITGLNGFALAEETQQKNNKEVITFSKLKVSGAQKQIPLVKALEKLGAFSAVGTENKLQGLDKIIRTMPGT
ncbi:hypothetical protein M2263_000584 [Providencia alcalifaciens]|nr:hypothetical protein [Providencia alcalifaciens]